HIGAFQRRQLVQNHRQGSNHEQDGQRVSNLDLGLDDDERGHGKQQYPDEDKKQNLPPIGDGHGNPIPPDAIPLNGGGGRFQLLRDERLAAAAVELELFGPLDQPSHRFEQRVPLLAQSFEIMKCLQQG